MRLRTTTTALLAAAALVLGLAACATDENDAGIASPPDTPLRVGVTGAPHDEILRFVKDNLAPEAGLGLEIVEYTDQTQPDQTQPNQTQPNQVQPNQTQPNQALANGQLDANYFQHMLSLDEEKAAKGYKLTALRPVHIEPLGVYSKKVRALADLPAKSVVAVPDDSSGTGRALNLLAQHGVIKLKDGVGVRATQSDIVDNPNKLQFRTLAAAQLPASLDDATASVISGKSAVTAGLKPADEALALEKSADNPYANVVVVRAGDEQDPRVLELERLLRSPEVKKFIEDKYQGSVRPAF